MHTTNCCKSTSLHLLFCTLMGYSKRQCCCQAMFFTICLAIETSPHCNCSWIARECPKSQDSFDISSASQLFWPLFMGKMHLNVLWSVEQCRTLNCRNLFQKRTEKKLMFDAALKKTTSSPLAFLTSLPLRATPRRGKSHRRSRWISGCRYKLRSLRRILPTKGTLNGKKNQRCFQQEPGKLRCFWHLQKCYRELQTWIFSN